VRPARAAAALVVRVAPSLTPRLKRDLWKLFYELASRRRRLPRTALMNYGYAFPDDRRTDDPDRFGRQLYEKVSAAGDLSGRDVLDIGCGRGGGTAFVFERFRPRTMTGLDLASSAIARCRAENGRPGLTFVAGDVLRARELDSPNRRSRLERGVPRPLRRHALAFAAVEGGAVYRAYEQRLWTYLRFALQKHHPETRGRA
jgi:SAM-dependent methyltransferase